MSAARCKTCHGPGFMLGVLGRLRWWRCRDCGVDFATPFRRRHS